MSDIENAIKAAGADKAPRITPDDLEANILYETHFTAAEGALQADGDRGHESLALLSICVLVLRNGFTVTGVSACASPENFNAEIGKKIARENAMREIWPLMGYALKEHLFQRAKTAKKPMPTVIESQFQEDVIKMCSHAALRWSDNTVTVGSGPDKEAAYRDAWNKKEQENV